MRTKETKGLFSLAVSMLTFSVAVAAESFETRAVIKADKRATLSAEIAGKVSQLPFNEGSHFRKGALLLALDCRLYIAQTEKVKAERKAAQIQLENAEELKRLESINLMDVALAEAELAMVDASLRIATLNDDRCELRAPWDGTILKLDIAQYENVQPHQQLIEIINQNNLKAEVVVPANWYPRVHLEQKVSLVVDENGITYAGNIEKIIPAIDPSSQTFIVKVNINKADDLIPGMSATAKFEFSE